MSAGSADLGTGSAIRSGESVVQFAGEPHVARAPLGVAHGTPLIVRIKCLLGTRPHRTDIAVRPGNGTARPEVRRRRAASAGQRSVERRAIISISTRAAFGRAATANVERAGGGSGMCVRVDGVDGGEVADVGEEDRGLDDVRRAWRRRRRAPPRGCAARDRSGPRCRRRARRSPGRSRSARCRTRGRRLAMPWL